MGFNPEYTVGIWSGFDDNRELEKQIRELEDTDIIGMVLRASCRAGRRRLI